LQIRLGEYQRWVLQKEERPSRHSLIPKKNRPLRGGSDVSWGLTD
jgi:hypothetical protein